MPCSLKFTVEHDKVDVQPETTGISETIVFSNAKEADKVVIPPASTSAFSKRSRIYRNIPDLEISTFSTRKKQLINIIRRKEDQLRKVKKLCKRRGNDLKKLSNLTDSNVVRNLFNNMPSVTAKFMMSQIKSYSAKSARGRRWDFEEKVLALTIFKRSPKCYRLLRSFVALPSKKTLLSMLRKVPFQTGINSHIFQVVNENVLNGMDRWCVLLFDEMDIQLNIQYDAASDGILGFEDMGFLTSNRPANKALVFMLVGITRNWKQPVAYYFNSNGCKADMLRKCIFDVLDAAKNIANVNVVATICDMGVNNVKCMKDLGVTVDTPFLFTTANKYMQCMIHHIY
ncbi:hypothetical protein ABEB36_012716 [Hypothenemus hampei]|uniref:Transposable element P transposase-like RNase H domain-containing protein n=1 Tax=Hypothenemus hampei TaxID=57062 RepID=A0ABD1EC67_HYPHA